MFVTEKLKTFSWVNVGNPDHEDFEKLQTKYKIDEDTISDILDPDEQPRIEVEDDYKVIIVRFPIINRETDTLWHTEPLSIIYSTNQVITVCRKRCDILDKIKKDEKGKKLYLASSIFLTSFAAFTDFIDGIKDAYSYYHMFDGIENRKNLLDNVIEAGEKLK